MIVRGELRFDPKKKYVLFELRNAKVGVANRKYNHWVVGVVKSFDGTKLFLDEVLWSSYPKWKDFYPKEPPFNLSWPWLRESVRLFEFDAKAIAGYFDKDGVFNVDRLGVLKLGDDA